MSYEFTESQKQRLIEHDHYSDPGAVFGTEAERDEAFTGLISKLQKANEKGLQELLRNPRHHRLLELELKLSEALIAEGFIEVKTPVFISKAALAKMTIDESHPLYRQVFWIDGKRALRPMHAPNLYYVMRKLRDHTDGPVRIFEIGSCFRAESHSNDHLEEFTMLNLVEMGPEGDPAERIRHYIDVVMRAVGLDYELVDEESDVYRHTIDVEVEGEEVCSAAVGPHVLDPAHDVHEPWCGAGFGLERLIMMKDGDGSVRKTGRSLSYLNGFRINRGGRMDIYDILGKCREGGTPSPDETLALLSSDGPDFLRELFETAASVRDREFGNKLFMYGFVYFSTYCRNDCAFCYYRRSNDIGRYRKTKDEVLKLSASLRDAGVDMVDLTMGEDPRLYRNGYGDLVDLVKAVRAEIGDLGIMVSPGAVSRDAVVRIRDAGADWFAVYQETYNRELFGKLRLEQDYQNRIDQRIWAREAGLLTEDGMLVGVGEGPADRAEQIRIMGELGCQQVRAMTFVPQKGTPMQHIVPSDPTEELKAIAVMRLVYPGKLIPASLDVEGTAGLRTRIDAGANVITSIVPPNEELAGVAQPDLDIDDGHRSVDYVKKLVRNMGRRVASPAEFREYIEKNRPAGCA